MLKKITLGSLAVLLVCLIGAALLAPTAITNAVEMAETRSAEFLQVKERQVLSAEGITAISLRRGYWIDRLTLRESPDGQIHILTDQYDRFGTGDSGMQYSIDKEGHLALRNYSDGQNPWRVFTKENILKGVVALFSNYQGMVVEIWVPKDVSFDLTSYVFSADYDMTIIGEVQTYRSVDEEELRRQQLQEEREREAYERELQDQMELEQEEAEERQREQDTQRLLEYSEYITLHYDLFSENTAMSAADFWTQNDETLEKAALILADYGAVDREDAAETEQLRSELPTYLHRVAEENLLILERNRLHRQYANQHISKEDFYARDLELDQLEAELKTRKADTDDSRSRAAVRRAEDRLDSDFTDLITIRFELED